MNYLQKYFYPMQNCEEALVKFCELLNVKVTSTSLKKDILEHPDYPSMLAVLCVTNFREANIQLLRIIINGRI